MWLLGPASAYLVVPEEPNEFLFGKPQGFTFRGRSMFRVSVQENAEFELHYGGY